MTEANLSSDLNQPVASTVVPAASQHEPGMSAVLNAINGLTASVNATNTKVDGIATEMSEVKEHVDRLDKNLYGNGSRKDRGWVGLIEELQAKLDQNSGRWNTIMAWGNSAAIIILGLILKASLETPHR